HSKSTSPPSARDVTPAGRAARAGVSGVTRRAGVAAVAGRAAVRTAGVAAGAVQAVDDVAAGVRRRRVAAGDDRRGLLLLAATAQGRGVQIRLRVARRRLSRRQAAGEDFLAHLFELVEEQPAGQAGPGQLQLAEARLDLLMGRVEQLPAALGDLVGSKAVG